MPRKLIAWVIVSLFFSAPAFAVDTGPTLTGVTKQILNLVDDGRWYPLPDWWMNGISSSDKLKTEISDESKKVIASAVWDFKANYDGDWAKVGKYNKLWPADNYDKLLKLAEGKYTLSFVVNDKTVWLTPFEVTKVTFSGKDHFGVTGPWKNTAYVYKNKNQIYLCFWLEGPKDFSNYRLTSGGYERAIKMKIAIEKDGKAVVSRKLSNDDALVFYPGKVTRFCNYTYDADKVLAADGEYSAVGYVEYGVEDDYVPLVKAVFPVTGGKIPVNEELSGEKADQKSKYITSDAYYTTNQLEIKFRPYKN